jgi:hypothetical protein
MFTSINPFGLTVQRKALQPHFTSGLPQVRPTTNQSLLNPGVYQDTFQKAQSPVRFGADLLPGGAGGDEGPNDNDPNHRHTFALPHYQEDTGTMPNPYGWSQEHGYFHAPTPNLDEMDMSTPALPKPTIPYPKEDEVLEDLSPSQLRRRAKKLSATGDPDKIELAKQMEQMARDKEPSKTGKQKIRYAKRGAPLEELSPERLYQLGRMAPTAQEAAKYYKQAVQNKRVINTDYNPATLPQMSHSALRRLGKALVDAAIATGDHDKIRAAEVEAAPIYDLAKTKRKEQPEKRKTSKQKQKQTQPTRSAFTPDRTSRNPLDQHGDSITEMTSGSSSLTQNIGQHYPSRRPGAVPPNEGHQPVIVSTDPVGWIQAQGDPNLWRYHYGDGRYSEWNTWKNWQQNQ